MGAINTGESIVNNLRQTEPTHAAIPKLGIGPFELTKHTEKKNSPGRSRPAITILKQRSNASSKRVSPIVTAKKKLPRTRETTRREAGAATGCEHRVKVPRPEQLKWPARDDARSARFPHHVSGLPATAIVMSEQWRRTWELEMRQPLGKELEPHHCII
jgi:hypothetical protein